MKKIWTWGSKRSTLYINHPNQFQDIIMCTPNIAISLSREMQLILAREVYSVFSETNSWKDFIPTLFIKYGCSHLVIAQHVFPTTIYTSMYIVGLIW